eukprot:Partr_v1_DN28550_c1_g1_i11_m73570
MTVKFRDRQDAGQQLADLIKAKYKGTKSILFALPRGGVPVAVQIAKATGFPLDVILVRKLGTPYNPELAMGAIASFGSKISKVVNFGISDMVPANEFAKIEHREEIEMQRRNATYRANKPPPNLCEYENIFIVDDGIATGATAKAAIITLRNLLKESPISGKSINQKVILAAPVMPQHAYNEFAALADDVITCLTPKLFFGVGQFYNDFTQTTDDEVSAALKMHGA